MAATRRHGSPGDARAANFSTFASVSTSGLNSHFGTARLACVSRVRKSRAASRSRRIRPRRATKRSAALARKAISKWATRAGRCKPPAPLTRFAARSRERSGWNRCDVSDHSASCRARIACDLPVNLRDLIRTTGAHKNVHTNTRARAVRHQAVSHCRSYRVPLKPLRHLVAPRVSACFSTDKRIHVPPSIDATLGKIRTEDCSRAFAFALIASIASMVARCPGASTAFCSAEPTSAVCNLRNACNAHRSIVTSCSGTS